MSSRQIFLVDAFTAQAFSGNSAGVVVDANGLTDPQMQAIAREVNSAETTFITRPTDPTATVNFRWFTPNREVEFCGHATLAGVHTLLETERLVRPAPQRDTALRIETRHRGIVQIRVESRGVAGAAWSIWIDMPTPTLKPCHLPMAEVVGLTGGDVSALDPDLPAMMTIDNDILFAVRDFQSLMDLRPNFSALTDFSLSHRLRGVFVTTRRPLSRAVAAHSRFFAPAYGVPEDPVTGSAHGPLGRYLVEFGVVPAVAGRAEFSCMQSQAGGRAGIVSVRVQQDGKNWRVEVGGSCVTTIRGELAALPDQR